MDLWIAQLIGIVSLVPFGILFYLGCSFLYHGIKFFKSHTK